MNVTLLDVRLLHVHVHFERQDYLQPDAQLLPVFDGSTLLDEHVFHLVPDLIFIKLLVSVRLVSVLLPPAIPTSTAPTSPLFGETTAHVSLQDKESDLMARHS